jgi:hypothetical protein
MTVNWTKVGSEVEVAVSGVVGAAWTNASAGASTQFAAIIAAGTQIENNRGSMKQAEYDSLKLIQQRALEGVLQAYKGISLDVAQQAAAAAWGAVVKALTTAYPALGLIL